MNDEKKNRNGKNKRALALLYFAAGAAATVYSVARENYLVMCIGVMWLCVGVVYLIRK